MGFIVSIMSCLRARTMACAVLLVTCCLIMLLLQMTTVAEDYRGTVDQCQDLPESLLRRWSHGSVSLTTPEVDHVVSVLKTDLSPLREVEDQLLQFGEGSKESWKLLQEVRKHRVQLACTNHLYSTGATPTIPEKKEPQTSAFIENQSTTLQRNATRKEDSLFHRYMDAADMIRTRKRGWPKPKISEIAKSVEEILEMRRKNDHLSLASVVNKRKMLSNFLVDDTNQYIYCYIPKVACTQWKKTMMVTARTTDKPFKNITHDEAHYNNKLPALSSLVKYTDKDVLERLSNYTKFLVVRSPMERLVSAYQDKFLSDNYDTAAFKKNYARPMIKAVRGEDVEDGEGLKFEEFLQFLTTGDKNPRSFQEHWKPMYDLCHPCTINYDFIAEFSTIEEDSNHILDHVMKSIARRKIRFPKSVKSRTPHILEQYLNELDPSLLEAVKRTYLTDLEMFGY